MRDNRLTYKKLLYLLVVQFVSTHKRERKATVHKLQTTEIKKQQRCLFATLKDFDSCDLLEKVTPSKVIMQKRQNVCFVVMKLLKTRGASSGPADSH